MQPFDPRVTLVMITRDRCREADRTLRLLARLPERPRIIVVDNGSADGTTRMVAERHPDVTLIALGENLASAGRTVGVRAATTPYVAFSDDDSWWEPGALGRAADLLDAHPTLALVAAHTLVGAEGREDPVSVQMARSPLPRPADVPGTPVLGFLAGMSVVRRDAYLAVGGFERRVGVGGEEAWVAADLAAAGWRLSFVRDVVARHAPSAQREPAGRRRTDLRNALWFAWTRRSPVAAARATITLLRRAPADRVTLHAVADALRGWEWVARTWRPIPPETAAALDLLDRAAV
ncbi:MAG TPA: glycosyltransferase family 2 protein [Euzebyales bacterium]|nr:glycosyltransferase family 2 protein [Euzebyales bacterium]